MTRHAANTDGTNGLGSGTTIGDEILGAFKRLSGSFSPKEVRYDPSIYSGGYEKG